MGMRIHKILGYGIHGKTHGIDQEALYNRLFEHSVEGEVAALLDPEIVKARAEKNDDYLGLSFQGTKWANRLGQRHEYPDKFHDVVVYAEFSDSDNGWWVIMPPCDYKKWLRWDDTIDYLEALLGDEMETVVKEINAPLYPYMSWMDKDTGKILKDTVSMKSGLRDRETLELLPNSVPHVPEFVGIIASHLGMPDRKLFRPVLIQWWA